MDSEILVSISCITYNHKSYIKKALDSFLMQKTNFKYEILIHDDASTDGTQDIIIEYQKKYPHIIKPILQSENQYSKGIKRITYIFNDKRAQGKYIALCEGDDFWTDPTKLQKQVDYMESHNECSMCFHATKFYNNETKSVTEIRRAYNKSCIALSYDIISKGGGFIITNSMLYRKSALDNPPEFFFNSHVGDYAMQLIFTTKGTVYYINEPMSAYRIAVKGSWTSNNILNDNKNEKRITNIANDIKLLTEFNNYTNDNFFYAVERGFFLLLSTVLTYRNSIVLKDKRFKEAYNCLKKTSKFKLILLKYFPNISKFIINIKSKMKKDIYYGKQKK